MNKVNFKKVIFGLSLGTVMALGFMSSAFAADINHPTAQAKTVQQQKPVKTQEQAKANALKQDIGTVVHGQDGKDHRVKVNAGANVRFTQEQIKAIALQQYAGTVRSIKLSNENGVDVYVVIINGSDGKEHTVKITAATGEIVPFTQDEVKDFALKHYKGKN
jgi:uncharacterized membrane protein YkoI